MHGLDVERMVDVHDNEFVISNPGTGAELQQRFGQTSVIDCIFLEINSADPNFWSTSWIFA